MKNDNNIVPGQVEYLNPKHRYYIVIALKKDLENNIYDCHFLMITEISKMVIKDFGSTKECFY